MYQTKTRLLEFEWESIEVAKDEPWYVESSDYITKTHCLKLVADNGKEFQLEAPWCGYFEILESVAIIVTGMRIEF